MSKLAKIVLLGFSLLNMAGCSHTTVLKLQDQTHFTHPDNNVTRLGSVHGEATKWFFYGRPDLDSQIQVDAINNALNQKPGAQLIIDSVHMRTDGNYFLFFNKLTYQIDGQAAKVEIAKRSIE